MTEAELTAIEERCAEATEGPWEWRPFASAPTNRTEILVYREDAGVFTALFTPALAEDGEEDEDNYCWFTPVGEDLTGDLPTHWMPFPHGPESFTRTDIPTLVAEVRRLQDRATFLEGILEAAGVRRLTLKEWAAEHPIDPAVEAELEASIDAILQEGVQK